jgi:hypothetical protein
MFDLRRIHECSCGFDQPADRGLALYRVACSPQIRTSGAVIDRTRRRPRQGVGINPTHPDDDSDVAILV